MGGAGWPFVVCGVGKSVMLLPAVRAVARAVFLLRVCSDAHTRCVRSLAVCWHSLLQDVCGNEHARADRGVCGRCDLLLVRSISGKLMADPREDRLVETREWAACSTLGWARGNV